MNAARTAAKLSTPLDERALRALSNGVKVLHLLKLRLWLVFISKFLKKNPPFLERNKYYLQHSIKNLFLSINFCSHDIFYNPTDALLVKWLN